MIQTTRDNNGPADFLKELFGDVIFSYTDADAIADGVLIPFISAGKDTGHRITSNAFRALKGHYTAQYPKYQDADFYRSFFNELLPLVPEASRVYKRGDILTTDFNYKVEKCDPEKQPALVHPERSGRHHPDTCLWRTWWRSEAGEWVPFLGDLAACGYDSAWDCIPALAVGAPPQRDRIFVFAWKVANPQGKGCGLRLATDNRKANREGYAPRNSSPLLGNSAGQGLQNGSVFQMAASPEGHPLLQSQRSS